ncbi:MAG: response regulator [Chthoniobacterales bacterium]
MRLDMNPLEIVHLEDSDLDAELVREDLVANGVEAHIVRVHTEKQFRSAIARAPIDVILADSACPKCDGYLALAIAKEKQPNVPFIFVSGAMSPPDAIESLSRGATDFVFKEHLTKLVPAIRRAVKEAGQRVELARARAHLSEQAELLDQANDSIIQSDAEGIITYWNRGSEKIYGWSREEAVGKNVHELLQTKLRDRAHELEETLRKASHWEGELEQVRRDGTAIYVASHWTLKGTGGDSQRLQINSDITARKKTEEALRVSEERYRRLVDEGFTANFIMRPDGSFVTCNPAFVEMLGLATEQEALATNFMSLMRSRKDGTQLFSLVAQHGTVERHELEMRQPSGEALYVVARLVGTFDQHGHLTQLQGYLFNDTKRKRLERQLVQAQKMEGLGTLAGGIAHDFNNILAIILGYTNQLEKWEKRPEIIPGALKVIREAVERGASLVQQLLASARQAEARLSPLDLNALVRELEKMLHATFPKMISFELHLESNLPSITADRSQIHQVLLNLCVNARDAMPNGGVLTVETAVARGEELAELFTGAEARSYGCLRVRDTGVGMSPEVKAHIFEPFFTTKERAKGTGLGLSVVYGVVNNHHGFVQVESEPNVGTTFSIYLPLASSEHYASTRSVERRKTRAPQTILLVEDEEMLRELGTQILEGEGYRVLTAKDGEEAVETFVLHRDEIGLVVCDLGLPKLGGRDAFLKMKRSKPSVRAIVASGYLEPAIRSEILKAGVLDCIQKPYDFRELLGKVRSVIGKAQSEDDHPQLF